LREKIKNQYIALEGEILKNNNIPEEEIKPVEREITVNYNNLETDVINAVLKDKIFEKTLNKNKKQDAIRAIYLSQVLRANQKSSENYEAVNVLNTPQNTLDSLHSFVIQRITNEEDNIIELKSSMKTAMEFLMQKTQVVKASTQQTNNSTQAVNTPLSPFTKVVVNIQNILKQPEIRDHIFKANFAVDNKLIEDRKGFIPCPLPQGTRTVRYEEKVNGRKHDGVVFTSKKNNVENISQGTVVKVGASSGKNKYVIVKHDGDYMSVYAYLKQTYVSENQHINSGQVLGEANLYKNDSYAIHFQMWKGSQSLNPSRWIKNN
jgi:septal ring factor EnvC (AmiA/AmiB activator)